MGKSIEGKARTRSVSCGRVGIAHNCTVVFVILFLQERRMRMQKLMCKLCGYLEKKLYAELTWEELARRLYKREFQLEEARAEIVYLKKLIQKQCG